MNHAVRPAEAQQADALVEEIARKAQASCAAIAAAAARDAADVQSRAREKARRRLRRALEEMRASAEAQLARTRAEIETARTRSASAHAHAVVARAWPQLGAALARRWADPAARARWIDAQLAVASARLPAAPWVVSHPAPWGEGEVAALRDALARSGAGNATLRADAGLDAGLVIESSGVRLDASPAALLADRPAVEAMLLAELLRADAREAPGHG